MAVDTPDVMYDDKKTTRDPEKESGLPQPDDLAHADGSSIAGGSDILSLQDVDPVLNMKMHLVNNVSYSSSVVYVPACSAFPRPGEQESEASGRLRTVISGSPVTLPICSGFALQFLVFQAQ